MMNNDSSHRKAFKTFWKKLFTSTEKKTYELSAILFCFRYIEKSVVELDLDVNDLQTSEIEIIITYQISHSYTLNIWGKI